MKSSIVHRPSSIVHEGSDYREIFGNDYLFAEKTIEKNSWWRDSLSGAGFDPGFALAIIFPELIRYSGIVDYIETRALEVLYVQYGRDYADFSIGLFQMKPSFAERIEGDIVKFGLTANNTSLSALVPRQADTAGSRSDRIARLKDGYHQLLYLEAFIMVMDHKYPEWAKKPPAEKLVFYSTAYNTGYFKDESVIRNESAKKRFYSGMNPGSVKYSYADISVEYFLSAVGY